MAVGTVADVEIRRQRHGPAFGGRTISCVRDRFVLSVNSTDVGARTAAAACPVIGAHYTGLAVRDK